MARRTLQGSPIKHAIPQQERPAPAEVYAIWGSGEITYTRGYIKHKLTHWRDVFETSQAERSLHWATVKGEFIGAVKHRSMLCRLFFQLYCIEGLTFEDIHEATGWSANTCWSRWNELFNGLCADLCNTRVKSLPPRGRGMASQKFAYSVEGKFPAPVKP
jgi:hypothetical protein